MQYVEDELLKSPLPDACPGPASPQTFHTDVPNPDCPECGMKASQ